MTGVRRRFFVDGFGEGRAEMRGDAAHHLARVLRAEPGQQYELSDGHSLWLAEILTSGKARVEFRLLEPLPAAEPAVRVTLLLSVVKFDRFEWALEKATELGAGEIIPVAAARSEKKLVAAAAGRAARWRKILLESAQQSRRLRPPTLQELSKAAVAFAARDPQCIAILLSERERAPSLRVALSSGDGCKTQTQFEPGPRWAALAIGPEGGWTEEEVSSALGAGFREASLGPTILRTETAVVAALAAINYALGE
jgi:16S rRNA (uracil1498-N3)-methyltransferase